MRGLTLATAATLAIACAEKPSREMPSVEIENPRTTVSSAVDKAIPEKQPESTELAAAKAEIERLKQEAAKTKAPLEPLPTNPEPETPVLPDTTPEPRDLLSEQDTAAVAKLIEQALRDSLLMLGKCKDIGYLTGPSREVIEAISVVYTGKNKTHIVSNDLTVCADIDGAKACAMEFNVHDPKDQPSSGFTAAAVCIPKGMKKGEKAQFKKS